MKAFVCIDVSLGTRLGDRVAKLVGDGDMAVIALTDAAAVGWMGCDGKVGSAVLGCWLAIEKGKEEQHLCAL